MPFNIHTTLWIREHAEGHFDDKENEVSNFKFVGQLIDDFYKAKGFSHCFNCMQKLKRDNRCLLCNGTIHQSLLWTSDKLEKAKLSSYGCDCLYDEITHLTRIKEFFESIILKDYHRCPACGKRSFQYSLGYCITKSCDLAKDS